jgi:hypothetical protein
MRAELNPFAPGSGLTPPALVGRVSEIDAFDLTVARSRARRPSRGMVLHGLRGVGKTVLLNRFREHAEHMEWLVVELEGRPGEAGQQSIRFGRALMRAAVRLNSDSATTRSMRDALGSIVSFADGLGIRLAELGIEPTVGRADSGHLEVDLEELIEDLCRGLRDTSGALGVFIDEMQDLDADLLGALLSAQHRAGQKGWPFYIIGAGLPGLPATLSGMRSYAERLFDYRHIGPLEPDAAREALVEPVEKTGASFDPRGLDIILEAAGGYPYFLQTYGQAAWDVAEDRTISEADAGYAIAAGNKDLDMGFYLSRWERVTPAQRTYLRAMAGVKGDVVTTAEIAERLGKPLSKLSVVRQSLIAKGLVFAPERGQLAFSVPGMPDYIRRQFD